MTDSITALANSFAPINKMVCQYKNELENGILKGLGFENGKIISSDNVTEYPFLFVLDEIAVLPRNFSGVGIDPVTAPEVCKETSAVCTIHPVGYERGKNGVSLIINPNMLNHPSLKDLQVLAKDTLNGTFLFVKIGNLKILCVYYSPSCPEDIDTWLEEIISKCQANTDDDFILLGDFNARSRYWKDHGSNAKGRCLKRWIEANNLQ